MASNLDQIQEKINRYKKRYHLNQLLKGLLISSIILLTLFLVISSLEFSMKFGKAIRATLFFSFIGTSIYVFYQYVLKPLLAILSIRGFLDDEKAAKQIGAFFPNINDKLLNTLQLYQEHKNNELALASVEKRAITFSSLSFEQAISWEQHKKYFKFFLIPMAILIGVLLIAPSFITDSSERIIQYNKTFIDKAPFDFKLENESLVAFRNEEFTTNLSINGKYAIENAFILSKNRKIKMNSTAKANSFSYTFDRVQQDITIQFYAKSYESKSYTIKVVDRPSIQNLIASLTYPKYLNKKPQKLENVGNLIVPEGTKVDWKVDAPFAKMIKFQFDTLHADFQEIEESYIKSKTMRESSNYSIELKNDYGKNAGQITYSIEVIKDEFPKIQLEQFQDTTMFKFLVVGGNISDDYGIKNLKFYYRKNTKDSYGRGSSPFKSEDIKINKSQQSQSFYYRFNLENLGVKEGEQVEYYLSVWDNDGFNGSKSTKSSIYTLNLPTEEEIAERIAEGVSKTQEQMDRVMKEARDLKEAVKETEKKLKNKKEIDWKDQKEINELIEKRENLEKEIDKMLKENQSQLQQQERFSEIDQRILEKTQQLQELMEELLDEETKKLYEELQKLLQENAPLNEVKDIFEEIDVKEESLEKEIEQTLELFKEMKFDQKFEENTKKIEQLAKEQNELSNKTKDKSRDIEELKLEQRLLDKRFEDFKKDMEELEEFNQERKRPDNLPDFDKSLDKIDEQLNNTKESLEKNKRKEGSKNQKSSAQEMKDLADRMRQAQEETEMESLDENIDNLRAIMDNLIKLSFTQEDLMKDFRGIKQSDPRFITLSQEQLKVTTDSKIVQDSLRSLGTRVFQINAFISDEIQSMNKYMEKATNALKERKLSRVLSNQQGSMTSMNNLALMLDDVLSQLQNEKQQASGSGKGKKKKSGGKPKLSDLQKSLSQQIQNIKRGKKKGRQLSESVAKAAAEQERLRKMMREMMKQMEQQGMGPNGKKNGEGEKPGGKQAGGKDGKAEQAGGEKPGGKQPGGKDSKAGQAGGEKPGDKNGKGKSPGGNQLGGNQSGGEQQGGNQPGSKDGQGEPNENQNKGEGNQPGGSGAGGSEGGTQLDDVNGTGELKKANNEARQNVIGKKEMEELLQLMERNEVDLVNKNISDALINRQDQIITRLLEAEESLRERELDQERKGETALSYEELIPEEFEKYIKEKEKEIELLRTVPLKLNPYYKKQVNEYFKRLNENKINN